MTHRFDYAVHYPSARLPLFARNVVATSHPLAAQAGLSMLAAGGNAIDAAVAGAAAMTILEPCSNGLGSDAFCILWDGERLHGLNASGRAPAAWTRERFASTRAGAAAPPRRGVDSITVPGAVSAWAALSKRFGRLPFADLMQPAIELAERGFVVPVVVGQKWAAAAGVADLVGQPGFAEAFLPHGRAPAAGELFRFPAAARALRSIAASAGESFYRGELAQAIAAHVRAHGGALAEADLAAHAPDWVEPIGQDYRGGFRLHQIPPNGQGLAALIALGLVREFELAGLDPDGPEAAHLQIEAMKLAFADVYCHVCDPASMRVTVDELLDPAYLKARARLIDPKRAQRFGPGRPPRGGTIYLAAADESGWMVSFIQSNYMGFGSGVVVPGWGVSLQNRGHGFSLDAASPNVVAPGKRPFHTIIPGFLTENAAPRMAFGVMGANMQPQGHLQTLVRMLDFGQNPQAACDAPRWRFNEGLSINVEASMPRATLQGLVERGHEVEAIADSYQDFGAGQFVWRLGDPAAEGYVAASDPRRDGAAVGR